MATTVLKRNLAILIITALLLCFTCASVLADDGYPFSVTQSVTSTVSRNGVAVGNPFALNINLTFDDSFIEATEGIIVLQFRIKYDSNKLQFVDPETLESIEFDDAGDPISGKPYTFGSIGVESRFITKLAPDKLSLICSYYSSQDVAHDIVQSGLLAKFALKPLDDLMLDGSTDTTIKITDVSVFGSNSEAPISIVPSDDIYVKITAPVVAEVMGEAIVGGDITVAGKHTIKDKSEPLTMYILKDGYEVEDGRNISLNSMFFNEVIHFDENIYEGGSYKIVFAYKNTTQNVYVQVKPKQEEPDKIIVATPTPSPTPEQGETDEPGEDDTPTESPTTTPSNEPTPTPTQKPTTTHRPSTGTTTKPVPTNTPAPSTTPSATPEATEEQKAPVEYPSDIDKHWASENIKYVYENKLMNGYEDGTFAPEGKITRAEFAAVITRLLELEEAPDKASGFSDAANHWAKGYIGALSSRGIVSGVSETEFAPGANITREQIALILFRALELEKGNTGDKYADDGNISPWAYDAVYAVYASGLMKGDTNGNFSPKASATRAEVATILYRLHSAKK